MFGLCVQVNNRIVVTAVLGAKRDLELGPAVFDDFCLLPHATAAGLQWRPRVVH